MIEDGTLAQGYKLPTIRALSKHLKVNNMTVISAYKYLESHHFIYSLVGSGTYVAPERRNQLPEPILKNQYNARQAVSSQITPDTINFADTSTDAKLFPVEAFKKAFDDALARDGGLAFDYQDSQGYEPLRESLCAYLETCSIKTSPSRIQIISGAQQGLDILAKALLEPGDVLLTEQPTFYGAVGAFATRGATVYEMPMEDDGPDMDAVESLMKQYRPRFLYVMPNFQTPTGISYGAEKKHRLLELVYKYESYIIEEDNQNDFYYDGNPRVPLKALDYRNRCIYVKSFSKILMPGLRIGCMVLPRKLAVATVKRNTDIATSGYIQRAFDLYLRDGGYSAHCAFMRGEYGKRYQTALEAIKRQLTGYVKYTPPDGGLSFWLTLSRREWSGYVEEFCEAVLAHDVIITPGSVFSARGDAFRVSFAAVSADRITEGINVIASVLRGEGK
jgi:DNA-binding transcriptional MocR family regulator